MAAIADFITARFAQWEFERAYSFADPMRTGASTAQQ